MEVELRLRNDHATENEARLKAEANEAADSREAETVLHQAELEVANEAHNAAVAHFEAQLSEYTHTKTQNTIREYAT